MYRCLLQLQARVLLFHQTLRRLNADRMEGETKKVIKVTRPEKEDEKKFLKIPKLDAALSKSSDLSFKKSIRYFGLKREARYLSQGASAEQDLGHHWWLVTVKALARSTAWVNSDRRAI